MGATFRWLFNIILNPLFPALPPGTLLANLLGSFLMGMAIAFLATLSGSEYWRLFVITGFLGSLTTFSAFAGEMSKLIMDNKPLMLAIGMVLHVGGAILMVFLGMFAYSRLSKCI